MSPETELETPRLMTCNPRGLKFASVMVCLFANLPSPSPKLEVSSPKSSVDINLVI